MITINSRSLDGALRKSWTAELLRNAGSLLIAKGVFDFQVDHPHLKVIRRGTLSYEYFWLDRWYNVFRFHEPDGSFRNFYCNINMPPVLIGHALTYVDLDLDVVVGPSWDITVLDRDEFEENSVRLGYSDELRTNALNALDELVSLIEARHFPFNVGEIGVHLVD